MWTGLEMRNKRTGDEGASEHENSKLRGSKCILSLYTIQRPTENIIAAIS